MPWPRTTPPSTHRLASMYAGSRLASTPTKGAGGLSRLMGLKWVGGVETVSRLHATLHHEQAARKLGDLGNARAVKPLRAVFTKRRGSDTVPEAGGKALVSVRATRFAPDLDCAVSRTYADELIRSCLRKDTMSLETSSFVRAIASARKQ